MSHFTVAVLTAEEPDDETITKLLAPYDEDDEWFRGQEEGPNGRPESRWDWWVIGGRWEGLWDGENQRPVSWLLEQAVEGDCPTCGGSGRHKPEWAEIAGTCWTCDGTGRHLPTVTFAAVSADGEWHERGRMGWWAAVADEKDRDDWNKAFVELLRRHKDGYATLVDCHV